MGCEVTGLTIFNTWGLLWVVEERVMTSGYKIGVLTQIPLTGRIAYYVNTVKITVRSQKIFFILPL